MGPSISLRLRDGAGTLLSSERKPTVDELQGHSRDSKSRGTIAAIGP